MMLCLTFTIVGSILYRDLWFNQKGSMMFADKIKLHSDWLMQFCAHRVLVFLCLNALEQAKVITKNLILDDRTHGKLVSDV